MLSYFVPLLTTYLIQEKYSPIFNGTLLTLSSITGILSMPLNLKLMNHVQKRVIIYLGFLLYLLGFSMCGIDAVTGRVRTFFSVIGVGFIGYGVGSVVLPIMPEIIEAIE